ncbi:hypothetical protein RI129_010555 [Pyrocoelia pectoralis]|uniref:Uncharacterized protein n=1 Tax=Pyrocoelia pectoralis TaxID=417401 RepID=A0AAN7V4B8_9COLE
MILNLLLFCIGVTVIAGEVPFANPGFDFKGKVALITGGTRGIGFATASELLGQGVKGVALVGRNVEKGRNVARQLNEEFGYGRVIFVPADVGNLKQFEDAFKVTLFYWKGLDIFVNGAGINNETDWKSLISTNVVGSLQGTFLGFKYMSTANGRRGGVLINVSSLLSIDVFITIPMYSASRSFVTALGRALGETIYYSHNVIRVVTICPGATDTDFHYRFPERISKVFSPLAPQMSVEELKGFTLQPSSNVAKAIILMIQYGSHGSVWISEDNESPYEVQFPDRHSMK